VGRRGWDRWGGTTLYLRRGWGRWAALDLLVEAEGIKVGRRWTFWHDAEGG
jgi:hypothetical protein